MKTRHKWFALCAGCVILVVLAFIAVCGPVVHRAIFIATMFQGVDMTEEFADMGALFPVHAVHTGAATLLPTATHPFDLPTGYLFMGESRSLEAFLKETDTSGLVILHRGAVVYEWYGLTSGPETRWISWSVAKSLVSALVGIALSEGQIRDVRDPITSYVPGLEGSAYDGVAIEDILEMSSGASWDEDYGDPTSDITRFGVAIVCGQSQDEFAASLEREMEPGTFNRYNSTDTQVLGMLLVEVTGQTLAELTEAKLWRPLGMAHDAYWLVDDHGMELAFGGLNATARDYARFGELYRCQGRWRGRQIVPASWVLRSVTPGKPHTLPGPNEASDSPFGYGYQWWTPPDAPSGGDEGEFAAIGVYNQFIYVNPAAELVVVKTSANHRYGSDESTDREVETLAMFRAIADAARSRYGSSASAGMAGCGGPME